MTLKSHGQTAYEQIKEQIVSAKFMPGTLLSEYELAQELQMSRTPIRSAIDRLQAEGFVKPLKYRGVLVNDMKGKELLDMYETILVMVGYSIEVGKERNIEFRMDELEQYLAMQKEAQRNDDFYTYCRNVFYFKRCIISAAHNQAMLAIADSYVDKLMMTSLVHFKLTPHLPHYRGLELNQFILDALRAGETDRIKQLLKDAYQNARIRMFETGHF